MEVGAGAVAGAADLADHVADVDVGALGGVDRGEVGVTGADAVGVLDADEVAVAAAVEAGLGDGSALGGADGGAGRGGDVLAGVHVAGARLAVGAGDGAADGRGDLAGAAATGRLSRRGRRGGRERLGGRGAVRRRVGRRRRGAASRPCGAWSRRCGRAARLVVDGEGRLAAAAHVGHVGLEHRRPGLGVDLAGDGQAGARLVALDGAAGDRAEDAVVVHADHALDGDDGLAGVAVVHQRAGRQGDRRRRRGSHWRTAAARSRQGRERRGRRAGGHRGRDDDRGALAARGVLACQLGDLATMPGSRERALPQIKVAEIAMVRRNMSGQARTPWGLAPTGLAVGLAQGLRYAAIKRRFAPSA